MQDRSLLTIEFLAVSLMIGSPDCLSMHCSILMLELRPSMHAEAGTAAQIWINEGQGKCKVKAIAAIYKDYGTKLTAAQACLMRTGLQIYCFIT